MTVGTDGIFEVKADGERHYQIPDAIANPVVLTPPVGQPLDLVAEPWVPPVSAANVVMSEPQVFGQPGTPVPPGFHEWARQWVEANAPVVERKAAEYGSNSLARKGRRYAAARNSDISEAQALELGALQYVLEKMDRVEDSLLRDRVPSDDTLVDSAVYLMMILYIRANGRWL